MTEQQRAFVRTNFAPTDVLVANSSSVLKPTDSSGGAGIMIVDKDAPLFVVQPVLETPVVKAPFKSDDESTIELYEMKFVHGPLVYRLMQGKMEAGPVMTRIGPDPIVNWARGAQAVPCLPLPTAAHRS